MTLFCIVSIPLSPWVTRLPLPPEVDGSRFISPPQLEGVTGGSPSDADTEISEEGRGRKWQDS